MEAMKETLKYYLKYNLLVIDDFAIRNFTREEANDLYELIIERHEIKSSVLTSARAPEEWQGLFPILYSVTRLLIDLFFSIMLKFRYNS